jgi:hypothetical protein
MSLHATLTTTIRNTSVSVVLERSGIITTSKSYSESSMIHLKKPQNPPPFCTHLCFGIKNLRERIREREIGDTSANVLAITARGESPAFGRKRGVKAPPPSPEREVTPKITPSTETRPSLCSLVCLQCAHAHLSLYGFIPLTTKQTQSIGWEPVASTNHTDNCLVGLDAIYDDNNGD